VRYIDKVNPNICLGISLTGGVDPFSRSLMRSYSGPLGINSSQSVPCVYLFRPCFGHVSIYLLKASKRRRGASPGHSVLFSGSTHVFARVLPIFWLSHRLRFSVLPFQHTKTPRNSLSPGWSHPVSTLCATLISCVPSAYIAFLLNYIRSWGLAPTRFVLVLIRSALGTSYSESFH
jgi:hypothetical protein